MTSLQTIPIIIDNKSLQPPESAIVTTYSTHTKSEYVKYVSASVKDAIAAADSSQVAFKSWSQSLPRVRREILQKTAALLRENAVELAKIQVEETNCPEFWAIANVHWSALHLEEMSGRITSVLTGQIPVVQTPGQMGFVYKRPVGPVLSIPPSVAVSVCKI
jgi:acyl-CoA reductase-like NAD-dependent aldehyde dehydrogenase